MKPIRSKPFVLIVIVCVINCHTAQGEIVLENGPREGSTSGVLGFGWRPPNLDIADEYGAQTFTVPAFANGLERIEFTMNPFLEPDFSGFNTAGDIRFHVLVTNDADPSFESFRPTEVLFETSTLTSEWVPLPDSGFDEGSTQNFVIDTDGLTVTPGESYAFVLDALTEYFPGVFGWRSMPSTVDGFDSGEFFSPRVDRAADHTPVGSRPDHLSDTWRSFEAENVDLQFCAYFVPEPCSALVFLMGAIPFAIRRSLGS